MNEELEDERRIRRRLRDIERRAAKAAETAAREAALLRNVPTSIPSVTRFVDGYAVSVARVSILDGAMA